VRELSNTIQKALIFNRGMPISPEIISQAISGHARVRPQVEKVRTTPFGSGSETASFQDRRKISLKNAWTVLHAS